MAKPIFLVAGARPNFMKLAPVHRALSNSISPIKVVHTGQHYDYEMSQVFFDELSIPNPDYYLDVGSDTHARQTARIMMAFEELCIENEPCLVLVFGDVNSTVACSLVATKMHIPVAHVEAGLRSRNLRMPEEVNRILTDHMSDILFTTSELANRNLQQEGIGQEKIHFVGNVMIDNVVQQSENTDNSTILETLGLQDSGYDLITLHRPSNVDNKENLTKLLQFVRSNSTNSKIVFPMHPRTKKSIELFSIADLIPDTWKITDPLGYHDFSKLLKHCGTIWTDSGGIQEEATFMGVRCITLREETERPETVIFGTNNLVPPSTISENSIIEAKQDYVIPDLWDGQTSVRILRIISDFIETNGKSL